MKPDIKGRTRSERLAVEILTPVHIGSGATIQTNMDFVPREGLPFVVDQNRTFATLATGKANLDALLARSTNLEDMVAEVEKDGNTRFGYALAPLSGKPSVPETIRACLKDAFFRPYLPGSSLKGAIRTAIFSHHLRKEPTPASWQKKLPFWKETSKGKKPSEGRAGFAAMDLQRAVFGATPNHDLLRALHVGEALFATEALRMADVRWLNIVQRGGKETAMWRDIGSRRNEPQFQHIQGIFVEALLPGSLGAMGMQWDHFLLDNPRAWGETERAITNLPKDFKALREILNDQAQHRLRREMAFYEEFRVEAPRRECEELMNRLKSESEAAYVQLAWGAGWCGMTGDWMPPETVADMRILYQQHMGRPGMRFPKTRRLVVKGSPTLPMGWLRLWQGPEADARLQQQEHSSGPGPTWLAMMLATIHAEQHSAEDEILRGKTLAEAWQKLEDDSLKKAAVEAIRARWQEKGWWENPQGKAAKRAKAIYQGT